MAKFTKVNLLMTNEKALELLHGQMEDNTSENGKQGNKTEEEPILMSIKNKEKVNGLEVNACTG